jgi:outer membrane lipoprotein-sorting protein
MGIQRFTLATVAWLLAIAVHAPSTTAVDVFDEIYARGKPLEASLKTLTARFIETSQSPLLAKPLIARGTLVVIRPSRVALRYSEPDIRTVIIDAGKLRVVWPSRAIDRTTSVAAMERRVHRYFVDKSPAELRSHFDVEARVAGDRAATWLLSLTPKRKQIREGLSRLDLWINRESVMLSAMLMTFPGGDTKLMEFDDVRINPSVDEALFRPATP